MQETLKEHVTHNVKKRTKEDGNTLAWLATKLKLTPNGIQIRLNSGVFGSPVEIQWAFDEEILTDERFRNIDGTQQTE